MFVSTSFRTIPARAKRRQVAELREKGLTYSEISDRLKISKSTVAYHARNAGFGVDEKASRRYDWTIVQAAIDTEGLSMRQAMARFGFTRDSWAKAINRGAITPRPRETPIEQVLCAESRANRAQVKRRILLEGLKSGRCEGCGIRAWRDAPLALQLHHVNGNGRDNRIKNLQLLCPNCHSQTDIFAGRNRGRRSA
ncbi:hypothetical protein BH10ACT11_BH10ACT11_02070 [soil metagenome]